MRHLHAKMSERRGGKKVRKVAMVHLKINGIGLCAEEGTTILDAARKNNIEIPALCHKDGLKAYGSCGICVVEADGIPRLLRACSTAVQDGMVINTDSPRAVKARRMALELIMSDHTGDCIAPCTLACPAGVDCMGYIQAVAEGDYAKAVRTIRKKLPFPAVLGRICPHPCESRCRRRMADEPIDICRLKRFAADKAFTDGADELPEPALDSGLSVCVIGGGVSGLSAAYFLRLYGHKVTVFEKEKLCGGQLRSRIPEQRLPEEVLDREIEYLMRMGIEIAAGTEIISGAETKAGTVKSAYGKTGPETMIEDGDDNKTRAGNYFTKKTDMTSLAEKYDAVIVAAGDSFGLIEDPDRLPLTKKNIFMVAPARDKKESMAVYAIARASQCADTADSYLRSLMHKDCAYTENGALQAAEYDNAKTCNGNAHTAGNDHCPAYDLKRRTISTARDEDLDFSQIPKENRIRPSMAGIKYERGNTENNSETADRDPDMAAAVSAEKTKYTRAESGFSESEALKEAARCLRCGCAEYDSCSLIELVRKYDADPERFTGEKHKAYRRSALGSIGHDRGKCLLCGLCVRVCEEKAGKGILAIYGRGFDAAVRPELSDDNITAFCSTCRMCVKACPSGAMRYICNTAD